MKRILFIVLASLPFANLVHSQGCVTIRNINGFGQYIQGENAFTDASWLVNINTRYYTNSKTFKGDKDLEVAPANQNINHVFTMDFMVTRLLDRGWSISIGVPVTGATRETSAEHGGLNTTRHTTRSFGLGDFRIEAYKWILKPSASQKFNFQFGLGLKLPTGDYKYQDYFYKDDTTKILGYVNPSIQLGDGGTGIITELNAFLLLSRTITVYTNFYYLTNPREQNGTPPPGWRPIPDIARKIGSDVTSVPDQYAIRGGADFAVKNFIFSAGVRYEGVPTYDLIGGSNGIRRAGHNLSVEPGITYKFKRVTLYTYVPFMVGRETQPIVPDILAHEKYGAPPATSPEGGFADYLVFVGALFKLR